MNPVNRKAKKTAKRTSRETFLLEKKKLRVFPLVFRGINEIDEFDNDETFSTNQISVSSFRSAGLSMNGEQRRKSILFLFFFSWKNKNNRKTFDRHGHSHREYHASTTGRRTAQVKSQSPNFKSIRLFSRSQKRFQFGFDQRRKLKSTKVFQFNNFSSSCESTLNLSINRC